MKDNRLSVAAALVAIVALLWPAVGSAHAADNSEQRLAPAMVVLDASGSMGQKGASGDTRMDEAKKAMHKLLDNAPDASKLGLSVYGTSTGGSEREKAAGCKDIKTVQPVGKVDKSAMRDKVDRIKPRGYTPIGNSLRHADKQLPNKGKRSVVLVSDGQDTCAPPPPCQVAKELNQHGTDLAVHTVGFRVSGKARSQLDCIAEQTGGTYTDAPDAGSLQRVLPKITDRAQRSYQAKGTPVHGSKGPGDAPRLKPGQYVDRIPAKKKHNYQLHVPKGMTARIAATQVWPSDDKLKSGRDRETLQLRLTGSRGSCQYSSEGTANRWHGPVTGLVRWTNDGDQHCTRARDGDVNLSVKRDTDRSSPPEHELELLVMFEPPATGDTKAPSGTDPTEQVDYTPPKAGKPQPIRGGGSFNTAPKLPGPGRYSDSIKNGEWVAYRVWLDWGQALTYQLGFDDRAHERSDTSAVHTEVHGPDRTHFRPDATETKVVSGDRDALDPVSTTPVSYDNRRGNSGTAFSNDGAYLAGWHYITVRSDNSRKQSRDIPLDLKVNVVGNKIAPPDYAELAGYPGRPIGAQPGNTTNGKDENADVRSAATESNRSLWLWGAGGAVGLGAIAVIVTLVVLRRRRAGPWGQ